MSITITIAQARKIAEAADIEEIPDHKVIEIDMPSGGEFSGDADDEGARAIRDEATYEQVRTGERPPLLFLLDAEGTRL